MKTDILMRERTRIWIVDNLTMEHIYCGRTAVTRILFKESKAMILLQERLTKDPYKHSEFLQFFCNHWHIYITHVEVGKPAEYENNKMLLVLRSCFLKRSWINKLTILQPEDSGPVDLFFQLESSDYVWIK